jgi:glutathione synthase/RimK-type ligase-like ATP-grasp enzyme
MKIYAYKNGSKSAKALAAALACKLIKHEGKPLNIPNHVVINWGASRIDGRVIAANKWINNPDSIVKAVNKLHAFQFMAGKVSIPDYTTDLQEAAEWLKQGFAVVERHKLSGHSGEGINIVPSEEGPGGLTAAPLYVKYVKKTQEYRIHVFQGKVFFVQRKARNKDVPDEQVNWKVRNHQNGFIYAHKDVNVSEDAQKQAIAAVAALGLDFGAVDIIETAKGVPYVLEVNTACGLEGTTLDKYVEQFKALQA